MTSDRMARLGAVTFRIGVSIRQTRVSEGPAECGIQEKCLLVRISNPD
jgi:hypothetical protein